MKLTESLNGLYAGNYLAGVWVVEPVSGVMTWPAYRRFYGLTTHQTFIYFRKSGKDALSIRLLVSLHFLWCNVIFTNLGIHRCRFYFFGEFVVLLTTQNLYRILYQDLGHSSCCSFSSRSAHAHGGVYSQPLEPIDRQSTMVSKWLSLHDAMSRWFALQDVDGGSHNFYSLNDFDDGLAIAIFDGWSFSPCLFRIQRRDYSLTYFLVFEWYWCTSVCFLRSISSGPSLSLP